MSVNHAVVISILLSGMIGMAGCTGSPPAPLATPAPSSVTFSGEIPPASVGTPVPVVTYGAWTTKTPAPGHPYTKTYSFHGSGDYEDFTFTTDNDATWNFRMDPGPGNFLVSLKDTGNNQIAVLANGPGTVTRSISLRAGDYHFDIAADSPWYITMTTP